MKKKKIRHKTDEDIERTMGEGISTNAGELVFHKSQSSVTIKRDAKGQVAFEMKVYADNVDEAAELAVSEYEELMRKLKMES